jgi:8-oxo-dGTP pyrophosphatase MutT (NUDIX family)
MKKSSVCGIIVDGEILLLKRQYREGKSNGWCLPGGKVDPGESSIDAAIRETFEESGIKINLPAYVGKSPSKSGDFEVKVYFTPMLTKRPVTLSPREHSDYAWVKIDDVDTYELAGNTKDFINLILQSFGN